MLIIFVINFNFEKLVIIEYKKIVNETQGDSM
jgi:hypothetical protein